MRVPSSQMLVHGEHVGLVVTKQKPGVPMLWTSVNSARGSISSSPAVRGSRLSSVSNSDSLRHQEAVIFPSSIRGISCMLKHGLAAVNPEWGFWRS